MLAEDPLVLWHGSPKKIIGEYLLPHKARDVSSIPENCHEGIYALEKREFAIVMAILKGNGVNGSMLDFGKVVPEGIIIEGWPKQDCVYLYRLPAEAFHKISGNQWISISKVRPLEATEVKTKDFMHLIRPATDVEKTAFLMLKPENPKIRTTSK